MTKHNGTDLVTFHKTRRKWKFRGRLIRFAISEVWDLDENRSRLTNYQRKIERNAMLPLLAPQLLNIHSFKDAKISELASLSGTRKCYQ